MQLQRRFQRRLMLFALFIITMVSTAAAPMLDGLTPAAQAADTYSISGSNILKNNVPITLRGVNAMHVFGANSSDMSKWKIDIVREFIGNMRDTPLTGYPSYVNGTYLHSLQNIVNENRKYGKVTILCPFGWDGNMGTTAFLGKNPSQTEWWNDYKSKYRDIANQFKNQPDVWFEVWNEPYWYDRSHGYSDALWLSDMGAMVDNIRSTGATNIVIVPGAEMGQDEKVLLTTGKSLLSGRTNVGFDVHAYEKWLLHDSKSSVSARIQAVKNAGLAMLFGEVGPLNAGELMNPTDFLAATAFKSSTVMAWLWKYDGTDHDALLNADGTLNNNNNYKWGSKYYGFTLHSEAEGLTVEAKSGDSYSTFTDLNSSGGVISKLNANAVNDYVTYTVKVPAARTYNVRVGVKKVDTRGRFQLAVNGTKYGSLQDLYAASDSLVELDVANITFSSSGNKSFKFTVTDKNPSSKGYTLGFDYIKLIPM